MTLLLCNIQVSWNNVIYQLTSLQNCHPWGILDAIDGLAISNRVQRMWRSSLLHCEVFPGFPRVAPVEILPRWMIHWQFFQFKMELSVTQIFVTKVIQPLFKLCPAAMFGRCHCHCGSCHCCHFYHFCHVLSPFSPFGWGIDMMRMWALTCMRTSQWFGSCYQISTYQKSRSQRAGWTSNPR